MTISPPDPRLLPLIDYLVRVPAIDVNETPSRGIGAGYFENGLWWIKFKIDIKHELAWHVVQEFGHVLNYMSLNDRLPTVFMPVSPPPYLNGGPEFLSWVIEATSECEPSMIAEYLEGRLPRPVEDLAQWAEDSDD